MKTLTEFLVDFIVDANDFSAEEWQKYRPEYIADYNKAIEAYKKHLRDDLPKTVHWAMIEKDLITALERMQCQDSLEGAGHNKQSNQIKWNCLQPAVYLTEMSCVKCRFISACTNNKDRHCKDCLLFDLKLRGNCKEPGYGTKADNNACDRFKLNTRFKKN